MLFLQALLWATPIASAASFDPALRWQTLETEHFRITYHDGEEQLAREMAVDAEVAWDKLTAEIGTVPERKIEVVLVDWTDSANGYASLLPVNHIVIYVTAPEDDSTLALYRDWNEAIITHELAHILHLDTVEGLPRAVRAVMGRYVSVHQVSPGWIVEGYATLIETRHTEAGRGRNPTVDMVKRAAVLEGRFPPLGNLEGFQSLPPAGNLRYLFGQDFMQFIADTRGEDVWTEWIHRYGRGIPYLLPARRTFGASFVSLYREWRLATEQRYQRQAAAVAAKGLTPYRILSPADNGCGAPRWRPDGERLAYACSDPERGTAIWLSDPEGEQLERVEKGKGAEALAWRRDGTGFAYSAFRTGELYTAYEDVFLYELAEEASRSLTRGARARDPDFSPDGTKLLVVTNALQNEQLAVLTVDGVLQPLTFQTEHVQYDNPRWSPDGRFIAVSAWKDGARDLWIYTADGRPWRRLTWDAALDRDPAWSADGRWLYFTSDRTGIPNIYAVELETERLWQVTNVVTGAYGADAHPDGRRLAFQVFSTPGSQVAVTDLDPARWIDHDVLPRWPGADGEIAPGTVVPPPAPPPPAPPSDPWARPEAPVAAPDGWDASPWEAAPGAAPAALAPPVYAPPDEDPWAVPPPAADPWAATGTVVDWGATADTPALTVGPWAAQEVDPWAPAPPEPPPPPAAVPLAPPPLAQRADLEPRPYDPLPTLLPPRYWIPGLYLTSTGESLGLYAVAATGGSDLLGFLGYSGYLSYRSDAGFVGGGGSLVVNRWKPVLSASVSTSVTPYGDVYRQSADPDGGAWVPGVESTLTRYWDHRTRGGVSAWVPLSGYSGLTAYWNGTARASLDPLPADAYLPYLPTRGFFNTVGAGWSYGKGESYPLSISTEKGRSLAFGVELTPSWLGSNRFDDAGAREGFDQLQATAEWREYHTAPWLPTHVFAWKLAGGATVGDRFAYGSFRLGGAFSESGITVVPSEWRMLRGFYPASDSGEWYWLGSGEYRFPIWRIDRGLGTLPIFAKHLSGAVLLDAGNAFDEPAGAAPSQTLVGTGAEVRAYLVYGYGLGLYARLGYAFALTGGGVRPGDLGGFYASLGSSF